MRKLLALLLSVFLFPSAPAKTIRLTCREKAFSGHDACLLNRIHITSEQDEVDLSMTFGFTRSSDKKFGALVVDSDVIHYLPESLLQKFPECKVLQVVGSELKVIDKKTFEHTKMLEAINLERNDLKVLPHDTFIDLDKLKNLNLAKNRIKVVKSTTFIGNPLLVSLKMSFNEIERIHENTFKKLTQLEFLYLSHNRISELREMIFVDNKALSKIDLSDNKLKEIAKEIFAPLEGTLKILRLDNNECIENNTPFVKDEVLSFVDLQELLVENCLPVHIKQCHVEQESLKTKNQKLVDEMIDLNKSVTGQNLINERKTGDLKREISELKTRLENKSSLLQLEKDKVASQKQTISNHENKTKSFELCIAKVLECDLDRNQTELNQKLQTENKELEGKMLMLKENYNKCSNFELNCESGFRTICSARGVVIPFENMKLSIETNDQESLKITQSFTTFLTPDIFVKFPKLKRFDVTTSKLRKITPGIFAQATNLLNLSLNENMLETLPSKSFEGAKVLKSLKLERNGINTLSTETFSGLPELIELNLNNNEIEELPANIFDSLVKLATLQLSGNKIQQLGGNLLRLNVNLEALMIYKITSLTIIGAELIDNCPKIKEVYYGRTGCVPGTINVTDIASFKNVIKEKCK